MTTADRRGPGFWVALAVGWAVIGYAVVGLVTARQGLDGAVRVAVWVVAGHAVHDVLLVPVTVLIGLGIARVVPRGWRAPVQFGVIASAVVLGVAYPALRGFGRNPSNPSIQPLDYPSAVATVLAVVWTIAAAWLAVRIARSRPARAGTSGG